MLYDLNIPWSATTAPADLERTLRFAKALGYDVVALNHQVSAPLPRDIINPIPVSPCPPPSLLATASTSTSPANLAAAAAATATPFPLQKNKQEFLLPTLLRRATVLVADPTTTNYKLPEHARAYDLVAVRPTTERAFSWACVSQEAASLVSLDLASFLDFHLAPRTCMAAVQRGLRFEVCYGQAVATAEARQRANFIANLQALVRATKGRGIVVSSGVSSARGLRAPADVVNLLAVWGLGPERGVAAMGVLARGVVVNEGIKRRGFRGVIDVLQGAGADPAASNAASNAAGADSAGKQGKQGNLKNKNNKNEKKRRKEGGDKEDGSRSVSVSASGKREEPASVSSLSSGPGQGQGLKRKGGGEGDGDGNGNGDNPPMSKRQMKRLQKAAVRENSETGPS